MSFKCEKCGKLAPPHTQPIRVVVETREREYPKRFNGKTVIDRGGNGREIVREMDVCEGCAA